MCGICGMAGFSNEALLASMTDEIVHRGPDDHGFYTSKNHNAALGNRRLSILDLSPAGHMPMSNENRSLWITYNGEVYNFRELKADLISKGYKFKSNTDTEVILHGYEEYGLEILPRLNGMFSFAIWDETRQELLLARDRFGIKPLYYSSIGSRLLFASELKAILKSDVSRTIDPESLVQFLTFTWVPGPKTVMRDIFKLLPGHYLLWRDGAIRIRPYYDIPEPIAQLHAESFYVERFRELFKAAVRRHLISDVPLGLFLSGGIDSTALLAVASEITGQALDAYTIEYRTADAKWEQSSDDAKFAVQVAERFGARHHRILLDPAVADLLPKVAWHLDEPLADTAAISTLLICQAARSEVKVLLNGMGADELMAGYSLYRSFLPARYLGHVGRGIRRKVLGPMVESLGTIRHFSGVVRPGMILAAQRYVKKLLDNVEATPEEIYMAYRSWGGTLDQVGGLLSPGLKDHITPEFPYFRHREYFDDARHMDTLSRMIYVDMKTFLPDLNLAYSDKMSMAASLELRVPFLDADLTSFVSMLPVSLKLRGWTTKYIMRQAMNGVIPRNIIQRRKAPFASPMRQWLRADLRELVHDTLSPATVKRQGLLNSVAVGRVVKSYMSGETEDMYLLFALLNFALWYEGMIEKPNVAARDRVASG